MSRESFFSPLPKNVLIRHRCKTHSELRYAIATWIERTYNRRRGLDKLISRRSRVHLLRSATLAASHTTTVNQAQSRPGHLVVWPYGLRRLTAETERRVFPNMASDDLTAPVVFFAGGRGYLRPMVQGDFPWLYGLEARESVHGEGYRWHGAIPSTERFSATFDAHVNISIVLHDATDDTRFGHFMAYGLDMICKTAYGSVIIDARYRHRSWPLDGFGGCLRLLRDGHGLEQVFFEQPAQGHPGSISSLGRFAERCGTLRNHRPGRCGISADTEIWLVRLREMPDRPLGFEGELASAVNEKNLNEATFLQLLSDYFRPGSEISGKDLLIDDLGFDSLDLVELWTCLETAAGGPIDESLYRQATPRQLYELLIASME